MAEQFLNDYYMSGIKCSRNSFNMQDTYMCEDHLKSEGLHFITLYCVSGLNLSKIIKTKFSEIVEKNKMGEKKTECW